MYEILKQNKERTKYFALFAIFIILFLLLAVVFKNDKQVPVKKVNISIQQENLESIKKFFLAKINSPFFNINYKIKGGDSIQSILKKLRIKNNEIQTIIKQYKKYGTSNQLLKGNIIEIIIKKNLSGEDNSIVKFSIPMTKSTTIEIVRNDDDKIVANKIITRLYKKKVLAENIILENLYSSALEAKMNPETIIEFARIFGFEIDFQRDIRKNDKFQILYERFNDENGEFIKSGSILYAYMSINEREISLPFTDMWAYSIDPLFI